MNPTTYDLENDLSLEQAKEEEKVQVVGETMPEAQEMLQQEAITNPGTQQIIPSMPSIPAIDPRALQEQIQQNPQIQQLLQNYNLQQQQPQQQQEQEPQPNVVSETGAAIVGGAADAIESVGSFAELTGDTLKTGLAGVFGQPIDPTQNPFSEEYLHGDGNWLDIPDEWVPENHTGAGKFARGLVEFGLLTWATAGVGGAAGAGIKGTAIGGAVFRSANAAAAGNKWIAFAGRGGKIFAEGSVAELISSSSEAGNIANLAEETVPWLAPTIMNSLAVRPEDNPWQARLKTVMAGGGMNHVAHFIGAFGKGLWKARRHVSDVKAKGGKITDQVLDEADELGNQTFREEMQLELQLDEVNATEMAAQRYTEGRGIGRADPRDNYLRKYLSEEDYNKLNDPATSPADRQSISQLADEIGESQGNPWDVNNYQSLEDAGRQTDPFVNPELYNTSERSSYRSKPDPVKSAVREGVADMKAGTDTPRSYTPIASEPQIRAISRGNKNYRKYVEEVADDIADMAFKDLDNRLDYAEIKTLILRQAKPMLDLVEQFVDGKRIDLAREFKKAMDDPENYRVYMDDGNKITTTNPALKGANVLILHSLANTVSDIATGAVRVSDKLPINRQAEEVFDAMKVLLTENKKMGMMWGLDGKAQQYGFKLSPAMRKAKEIDLQKISAEMEEYFDSLMKLADDPARHDELKSLMELHALSQGKVRTLEHVHEFLRAKKWGGRMDDIHIKGMVRQQLRGTLFNSILGAPRTIQKALVGTNTIAMLRPFQAYLGAKMGLHRYVDEKEVAIAAAQIDSMGRAWAESWKMAQRNWELGVKNKNQDYQGKFDLEGNTVEWKGLKKYYEQFGTDSEVLGYSFIDKVVDFNINPWVKYSQNAMGAGDAFARTIVGRQFMAKKAALDAYNKGIDLKDIRKHVAATEENFRKEIFDVNKDGFSIVKDKAASMAGDEAALTKALEQNFKGFELLSEIPIMKSFFPFVRTGFNYLDVVLIQSSPAQIFRDKFRDLVWHKEPRNLEKYGLKPEEVAGEVALMEGRIAMGTAIMGMGVIAAMTGRSYGDLPPSKTDRDLWKLNKIEPHSFKLGNTYLSHKNLEYFSPLFSLTANIVNNADILGEKLTDEWLQKGVWLASATIIDQSMLSGIGDLAALMEPESAEGRFKYAAARVARAQLPFAAISGVMGDIVDNTRKEAQTLMEIIVRRDALFKGTVPVKYDILNKQRKATPLRYGADNPLLRIFNAGSPVPIVPVDDDWVRQNLLDIRYNLPDILSTYKGEQLTSQEISELQKYLATGNLRQYLVRAMKSRAYIDSYKEYKERGLKITDGANLKDAEFYVLVNDAFRKAKEEAWTQMLINNPALAERIENRALKKRLLRTGQYDRLDRLVKYGTN